MKKILLTICLTFLAVGFVQAQSNKKASKEEQAQMKAQDVYKQSAEEWATSFELSDSAKEKFIELYLEWQNNRGNIVDKNGYETKAGAEINFKKITVEEAEKLVAEDFVRQQKQAETDEEYYRKFQQYLTPGRAAEMIIQQRGSSSGMASQFRNMMRRGGFGGGMMMMF